MDQNDLLRALQDRVADARRQKRVAGGWLTALLVGVFVAIGLLGAVFFDDALTSSDRGTIVMFVAIYLVAAMFYLPRTIRRYGDCRDYETHATAELLSEQGAS